jgi:Ca2+:H+ antiporter
VRYLRYLLIFVPIALISNYFLHNETLTFFTAALGLIPMAGLLGEATEELSIHTGPRLGGLLNATLGNAAELIITIVALKAGQVELVKASITGSILGNLLLVLGMSLLIGGLKNGTQRFDRGMAGMSSTMLFLSVIGLLIPTFFAVLHESARGQALSTDVLDPALDKLSIGVAGVLIFVYVLSLIYSFRSPSYELMPAVGVEAGPEEEQHKAKWEPRTAVGVLVAATLVIVFLSEALVGAIEPIVSTLGVTETFLGVI